MTGLLGSYLAGIGKRSDYIFGLINALLIAYVTYKNGLFGSFIVNTVIFTLLEIYGFLSWSKNLDKEKNIKARKFTLKNALIVVGSCLVASIILSYILTLIPGQQLPFIDFAISCIDICALILMNLRYKEAWWLWIPVSSSLGYRTYATRKQRNNEINHRNRIFGNQCLWRHKMEFKNQD